MTDYDKLYKHYCDKAEDALRSCVPFADADHDIVTTAMNYSLLGGGKRVRAVLTIAMCEACGSNSDAALNFANAVEMIHAYSLIHDDLPCMDNDELRRGKPSCHIQFDEATALLAGDGLLTHAFNELLKAKLPPHVVLNGTQELADAAGVNGMIGGQVIDMLSENKQISPELLNKLNALKTGCMIRVAARLGCIAAGADQITIDAADRYAQKIGLAFQIVDDILDVTSTTAELGKPVGSDADNLKTTYTTLYGIDEAKKMAVKLAEQAKEALKDTMLDTEFFRELADRLAVRTK